MLFDILHLNGQSLIKKPYDERRQILEDLVQPATGLAGPGAADLRRRPATRRSTPAARCSWRASWPSGVDSIYQPGRRAPTWLKIKLHPHQEVVIGGWRPGQGRREGGIGSLLMGIPTTDGLRYVGRVGSGFNDRSSTT